LGLAAGFLATGFFLAMGFLAMGFLAMGFFAGGLAVAGFLPKSATVVTGCGFGRKGMLTGEARVDGVGSRTWVHPVKKKNIWRWPAEYALSRTTWNAYGAVGTPDT